MKWSAVAALCAAPLALAGTIQADIVPREKVEVDSGISGGSKGYSGSSGSSETVVEEVIIIWVNNGGGSATQTMGSTMSLASAAAATHTVVVGGSAGLVYTPNTIEAAVGDMVIFTFLSANHTATQSAFLTPCVKLDGGMDSGFMPNANNSVVPPPQMAIQVTVATPLWFYCKQKKPEPHCGKGMTFSINPTANKTQAMFEQMAIAQNGTGSTAGIVGGSSSAAVVAATSTVAVASATSAVSASSSSYMSSGSGSSSSGECSCSCFCGVEAFPAAVQGLEGFGGMSGSMPMAAMMP